MRVTVLDDAGEKLFSYERGAESLCPARDDVRNTIEALAEGILFLSSDIDAAIADARLAMMRAGLHVVE